MTAAFNKEETEDLRGPAIIVTGSLSTGFQGHGIFQTVKDALEWFTEEKQAKYHFRTVVILGNVMDILFGNYVLVGTTGLVNPYLFFGPFDTPERAAQAAAIISEKSGFPIMFDILEVSKEEKGNAESQHDNNV